MNDDYMTTETTIEEDLAIDLAIAEIHAHNATIDEFYTLSKQIGKLSDALSKQYTIPQAAYRQIQKGKVEILQEVKENMRSLCRQEGNEFFTWESLLLVQGELDRMIASMGKELLT